MTCYTTDPVRRTAFFKKDYCAHQNHSIAKRSVAPKRFAPDPVQGHSHDIFAKSIHPLLTFFGNLSLILFVDLLLEELNGEALTY